MIIEEVAAKYAVAFSAMFIKSRRGKFIHARYECWHRLQIELGWSLPKIGAKFDMHHTTILYGIRKHRGMKPRERITEPNRVMLTINGETMCASQWAKRFGIYGPTVIERLNRGWPAQRAVMEKVNGR